MIEEETAVLTLSNVLGKAGCYVGMQTQRWWELGMELHCPYLGIRAAPRGAAMWFLWGYLHLTAKFFQ